MDESRGYRVAIKESAYEENPPVKRLLNDPDSDLDYELEFDSEEAAELATIRLTELGETELRLQPTDHDDYQAYILSTGKSTGGYGRTTRNASSGWEYQRKQALERDAFERQECGALGGVEGDVELHVNHITPKMVGGSDDIENLQTLCRERHMEAHDSLSENERASVGRLGKTISALAHDAYIPAFRDLDLYFWVNDKLEARVSSADVYEVLNVLVRYNRFAHEQFEVGREKPLTDTGRTSEHDVYYDITNLEDPNLLSYSDTLRYNGHPLHRDDIKDSPGRQVDLGDFS